MPEGDQSSDHRVTVSFDEFGWESLVEEARSHDVSVEELVVHAVLTYLADPVTDRISRRPLKLPKQDP